MNTDFNEFESNKNAFNTKAILNVFFKKIETHCRSSCGEGAATRIARPCQELGGR